MLTPAGALAAPAAASATPAGSGLQFAVDANGTAAPQDWLTDDAYYVNPIPNATTTTIYYTGATAGATVQLIDQSVLPTAQLGPSSTADSNGNGSIAVADSDLESASSDGVYLTDGTDADSATTLLYYDYEPSLSGTGASSSDAADAADVQLWAYAAIPDETINFYLDGSLTPTDSVTAANDGSYDAGFSIPSADLTPGQHSWTATTTDASGNVSDPATGTFDVAPPAPTVSTLFSGIDGTVFNTLTPSIQVTGLDDNAEQVTLYSVDDNGNETAIGHVDGPFTNNTATVSPSSPLTDGGSYRFDVSQKVDSVDSIDSLGLSESVIDTAAPTIEAYAGTPGDAWDISGTSTNDTTPFFEYSTAGNDNGLLGLDYTIKDAQGNVVVDSGALSPDDSWNWTVPTADALPDGTYTISAVTADSFGDLGSNVSPTLTFTIDTTAPTAPVFTSPTSGSTIATATPTVTITTDPNAVVELLVDGQWCDENQANGSGVATFTLGGNNGCAALSNGQHTIQAYASDEAGNSSGPATVTFTVAVASTTTTPTPTTPTPTTPAPTPTTPAPTTTTPAPTTASLPSTSQVTSSLGSALGGVSGKAATTSAVLKSGGATLSFKAPSAGTVTIDWYAKVKGKKVLIGSVTKTVGASGTAKLKVKLDKAGKKLLKSSNGSIKITQSGSFTPKGGKKSTTSKTLKLKG